MSSNRGLFLFNILFAGAILPAVVLLAGRLIDGGLCQLVGFCVVKIFVSIYPDLKNFKNDYILAQVVGWGSGIVVSTSTVSREVVVPIWVVLMLALFYKPSVKAYFVLLGPK